MGVLRQTYWIIGVKRILKKCVYDCTTCCRFRSNIFKQKMADLPNDRIISNRAYLVSGVNCTRSISTVQIQKHGVKH